jgi:hypothetical protein
MAEKYSACPFCGKGAAADALNYAGGRPAKFRIQCAGCKAASGWHDTEAGARKAWEMREAARLGGANLLFNKDAFVLNSLFYSRNRLTGNCTAQKEFRGKSVRIKEDVFLAAYEECRKITEKQEGKG